MPHNPDEAPPSLEETQPPLRESIDNAPTLVEQAKFMLRGERDEGVA